MDRLVNIDFGGRGSEELYRAARELTGRPLVLAAAESLARVARGSVVLMTTGSVSRAWISPAIGENDGPLGAAVVGRALALALGVIPVVYAEESLLSPIGAIYRTAGLSLVTLEQARAVQQMGGGLHAAVVLPYPTSDAEGVAAAGRILDEVRPSLLFSTERAGRNAKGIYHNAGGRDFGQGRARIDYLFEEGRRRRIPSIGVGDGGNEIGMGLIPEAVAEAIPYGRACQCGCGAGIGAVTATDVLVTAACSNWGCYAIVASLAGLLGDAGILHSASLERSLLVIATQVGLINSPGGIVNGDVDDIPVECHIATVELLRELGVRKLRGQR